MKKSKKCMAQNLSFTINVNELALNSRKFDTNEISRGTGIQKAKKGKGSYTRKNKNWEYSYGY
ncbi:hypothetical protein Ccar_06940 [Clostridium carboxidivorans P7]|uniref:Uncharacterized protein n=1 Tax=Clostridium carboxidivorans P7 TaxID=536227 RepID=C6PUC1_9CLOT|nr:ribosome alternative rescue factor ArfA [Clostridium carboxidivorans]AKN30575.1 hypothetical protein Ccar_06940 [Clostridium carboxidivorans P7]EET87119.1 hypothetical protein CcarbDRAFT_2388 [Clostridium carboxidivorans P7]EFG86324.1 hypothetical protein CLCAR_4150 [Clostridium carboxidivorans P7]